MDKNDFNIQNNEDGEMSHFSFSLPCGYLNQEKLNQFLERITNFEPAKVSKSLQNVYFTAINDKYFFVGSEEKLHIEMLLKLLTVLSFENEQKLWRM